MTMGSPCLEVVSEIAPSDRLAVRDVAGNLFSGSCMRLVELPVCSLFGGREVARVSAKIWFINQNPLRQPSPS